MTDPSEALCDEVLTTLRRITRAIDLHSRKLAQQHGLTSPQTLLLKELADAGSPLSAGELARRMNLSQATVTDVLNRLEKRGLVVRERSTTDKRRVLVTATGQAQELLKSSPPLLQERFVQQFLELQGWEQTQLLSSLQRVASMMDAESLEAAPLLASGPASATANQVTQLLEEKKPSGGGNAP